MTVGGMVRGVVSMGGFIHDSGVVKVDLPNNQVVKEH
jgi:hypothetical protein